jgi:uncharacterized protein YdhG (YjbR/CyaY superfamily)
MRYDASSPEEYISQIPEERKVPFRKLRKTIRDNIPKGFEEVIGYGMPGFVVPHSIYPEGYHCDPKTPLPFVNIASQKNFVAVYHAGIYADSKLMAWFTSEYPKYAKTKLDMGKSCIRFKKMDQIPFKLIGELMTKMTVKEWIDTYEKVIKNRKRN